MFKITHKKFLIFFFSLISIIFFVVIILAFSKRNNNIIQYNKAKDYIHSSDYDKAINILNNLKYEDSELLTIYCEANILINNKKYEDAINKLQSIRDFSDSKEQIKYAEYNLAIQYFENDNYTEAKRLFEKLENYSDSDIYLTKIDEAQLIQLTKKNYEVACDLLEKKEYKNAIENFSLIPGYKDSSKKIELCKRLSLSHTISAGILNSYGISKDGKVLFAGNNSYNQCDVKDWKNIVSIDGYGEYTIGLTESGNVKLAGKLNETQQTYISNWKNIIDIAAGDLYSVVLKENGTVDAIGHNGDGQCNVSTWKNIIDIDAAWRFTVGLTKHGELLFTGMIPNNLQEDYLNTKDQWKNVEKIAASGGDPTRNDRGKGHVVGLTTDGHVIAIGDNSKGQCNVESWENIKAIAAGDWYTVALTEQGEILITGENVSGSNYIDQTKIDSWHNIQDIAAGYGQTLVIKNDGHIDAMGFDDDNKCSGTISWTKKIKY